jgi:hypothetical protein
MGLERKNTRNVNVVGEGVCAWGTTVALARVRTARAAVAARLK